MKNRNFRASVSPSVFHSGPAISADSSRFRLSFREAESVNEDPERLVENVPSLIRARTRRDASTACYQPAKQMRSPRSSGCQSWSELETSAECADPAYFHQFCGSCCAVNKYFIDDSDTIHTSDIVIVF